MWPLGTDYIIWIKNIDLTDVKYEIFFQASQEQNLDEVTAVLLERSGDLQGAFDLLLNKLKTSMGKVWFTVHKLVLNSKNYTLSVVLWSVPPNQENILSMSSQPESVETLPCPPISRVTLLNLQENFTKP